MQRHDFAKYGYQGRADGRRPDRGARRQGPDFLIRRCGTWTAPISTASRSSRAGSTPRAKRTSGSATSPGSGDRKIDADGQLRAVGNTVNVPDASYTNTIGAPMLLGYWKDPSFNPKERGLLLRPRDRDPHAALDHLRRRRSSAPSRRRTCPTSIQDAPTPRRSGTRRDQKRKTRSVRQCWRPGLDDGSTARWMQFEEQQGNVDNSACC